MAVARSRPSADSAPNLSAKQRRALEALLVGASDQQAADAAKVSRQTVAGWRKLPVFVEALTLARSDMLKRTTGRIHAATSLAVKALEEVSRDSRNPAARVIAARALIEFSQRAIELQELEQRLEELETWFAERKQA